MRQAVEEGFIVDVLTNYTTYDQLFRLETAAEGTIEVPSGEASDAWRALPSCTPTSRPRRRSSSSSTSSVVRPLLGGEAKAMVVCESREEAVQWKRALDREIEKHGHEDVKTLVAFSGEVTVRSPEADNKGMSYTEPEMNKIAGQPLPESKLPEEFDRAGYGVLILAEKYQTGFDQPKLCGMYGDKKLVGVNAVQTLSRLNRSRLGKDRVYVLDFRNTGEEIRKAFEPYYGQTEATPSDPNVLFDAADAVRAFDVITDYERRSSRMPGRPCTRPTRTSATPCCPRRLKAPTTARARARWRHPAGAARRAEPLHPLLRLPLAGAAVHPARHRSALPVQQGAAATPAERQAARRRRPRGPDRADALPHRRG
jgi:type I restriction enzyme, R subunit